MDVQYQRTFKVYDEDRCNECDEHAVQEACNKCGEGVCMSVSCCESFPHHNNSHYVICRQCTNTIDEKLRLLKQKISKKMEKKIQKLTDDGK